MYIPKDNADFDAYMKQEEQLAMRQARIDDYVKGSMEDGGKFYPYKLDNFIEAIQNISDVNYVLFNVYVESAVKMEKNNSILNYGLVNLVDNLVTEYWRKCALLDAEQNVE